MNRVHIFISGEVTGVGFRLSTVYIARDLGLTGWVRNLPAGRQVQKGRVEIVAEGSKEKLDKLIAWVWEGPPLAQVEKVNVEWEEAGKEFKEFKIL